MSKLDDMTSDELEKLEKKIKAIYKQAADEVGAKGKAYADSFAQQIAVNQARLDAGDITQDYFNSWLLNQAGRGERWDNLKNQLANRAVTADKAAAAYINDKTPGIYSLNANYTAYEIESYMARNGGPVGVSFDLVDEQTAKDLVTGAGNHTEFRTVRVDPVRDYAWNSEKIQQALTQGILQGEGIKGLSQRFMDVMGADQTAAIRNARTSVTSAQNAGRQATYEAAHEMGIEIQKEWMSARDDRVRESHAELDGVRVGYNDTFPNGLKYPGDSSGAPAEVYNCRCTMRAVMPKVKGTVTTHQTGKTTETYNEWLENKKQVKNVKTKQKPQTQAKHQEASQETKDFIKSIEKYGKIKYNEIEKRDKIRTTEEIVNEIAGGDMTKGSCASVALAYIGQTNGYDIHDFRDGDSRKFFSKNLHLKQLGSLPGVETIAVTEKTEVKSAKQLIEKMENDKEYYFVAGRHAAMVKKTEDGLQYLELQSGYSNGWKKISNVEYVLRDRFGCAVTQRRVYGTKLEATSYMIDADSLRQLEGFDKILGYINTAKGEQKKGIMGNVK